jgi:hypothetical protein
MSLAKNKDGSDTTPDKGQNAAGPKPRSSLSSDLLKISALGGALLYGILFLGYYTYYRRLELRPEDLGVSYTYILVRSIGFMGLMCAILGIMSLIYLISTRWDEGTITAADILRYISLLALGGILIAYASLISPSNWPSWAQSVIYFTTISIAFIGVFLTLRDRDKGRDSNKGLITFAVLALLVTIVLPTAAVVTRANNLANQVLAGSPIVPYNLLGVPILDVSASPVTVTWIGPANQRPAIFSAASPEPVHGLLLGTEAGTAEAGTVVLLIKNGHGFDIVQIPSNLVIVEGS